MQERQGRIYGDFLHYLRKAKAYSDIIMENKSSINHLNSVISGSKSNKFKVNKYQFGDILLEGTRTARKGFFSAVIKTSFVVFWYYHEKQYIYIENGIGYLQTLNANDVLSALKGNVSLSHLNNFVSERLEAFKDLQNSIIEIQNNIHQFMLLYLSSKRKRINLYEYQDPYTIIYGRTGIYKTYVIYIDGMYHYFETTVTEHGIPHKHFMDKSAAGLLKQMNASLLSSKPVQNTEQISTMSRKAGIEINEVVQKIQILAPCEDQIIQSNAATIWKLANASNLQNVGDIFSAKLNTRWKSENFRCTWSGKIPDKSNASSGFVLRFDGNKITTLFIKCIFRDPRNVKIFYTCTHKKPTHAVFTRNPTPSHESGPAARSAGGP
jgi:hypothetical protein